MSALPRRRVFRGQDEAAGDNVVLEEPRSIRELLAYTYFIGDSGRTCQGERADFVFNMSEGVAEVVVDDVPVGRIGEGEIFGAMAALTHADRSATVRAKTHCSVVKVPKEQFTELIRSNPATIHSLLVDMANSIVNLNEQLVGLSAGLQKD